MITCSLCKTQEELKAVQGMKPQMPDGWSQVTIHTWVKPIRNYKLCRTCTTHICAEITKLAQ